MYLLLSSRFELYASLTLVLIRKLIEHKYSYKIKSRVMNISYIHTKRKMYTSHS